MCADGFWPDTAPISIVIDTVLASSPPENRQSWTMALENHGVSCVADLRMLGKEQWAKFSLPPRVEQALENAIGIVF
jgi:hypothetical protein